MRVMLYYKYKNILRTEKEDILGEFYIPVTSMAKKTPISKP